MPQTATAQPKTRQSSSSSLPNSERAKRGWSPERRARHAASIRIWAPWAKSTGPRTAAGKQRSAQNALKSGHYAGPMNYMREALSRQARFIRMAKNFHSLQKNSSNELLKGMHDRLLDEGRETSLQIFLAMEIIKKTDERDKNVTNELLDWPDPHAKKPLNRTPIFLAKNP